MSGELRVYTLSNSTHTHSPSLFTSQSLVHFYIQNMAAATGDAGIPPGGAAGGPPKLLEAYPTHDDFRLICNKKLQNYDAW